MESGGSSDPESVQAQAILARRAKQENITTYDWLAGHIQAGKRSGENYTPTRQTAKKWEDENPDYPEQAVRQGLVKTADLLPWAQEQLQSTNARRKRRNQAGLKAKYNPNAALLSPGIK